MKRFDDKNLKHPVFAFTSLKENQKLLFQQRTVALSRMDARPLGNLTIGMLQRRFNLNSYKDLLESIRKIRDLASIGAEVIFSLEGLRADRFTMVRDEVVAYISELLLTGRYSNISDEEKDFVARMLVAFESNPETWTLYAEEGEDNLQLQIAALYKEILIDSDASNLYVYRLTDDIAPLNSLAQFKAKNAKGDDAKVIIANMDDALTVYAHSATRLVDHVHSLLMDRNIWYAFLSPRFDARSSSSNIERGKSLRSLALYCQGLLNYGHHFALEVFLSTYDTMGIWVNHNLPALPGRIVTNLENVRRHDYLHAQRDVAKLFAGLHEPVQSPIASRLHWMVKELVAPFGLRSIVATLEAEANKYQFKDLITDLTAFDSARFLPLVSTTSVTTLDITRTVTRVLLFSKIVEGEIDRALDDLSATLGTNSSETTINLLEGYNLQALQPFIVRPVTSFQVLSGVHEFADHDNLHIDGASITSSRAYYDMLRKEFLYKYYTDEKVYDSFSDTEPGYFVDAFKAAYLRDLMDMKFKGLMPDNTENSPLRYNPVELSSGSEVFRNLIEGLTGQPLELAVIELKEMTIIERWATAFSSFALLYVDPRLLVAPDEVFEYPDDNYVGLVLKPGLGKPYGTTYDELHLIQGKMNNNLPYLKLANGVFLRFHTFVPIVTSTLKRITNYMYGKPLIIFESNGTYMKVDKWVICDSMLDHALIPKIVHASVPRIVFSSNYVYLNIPIFVNANRIYSPSSPEPTRQDISIAVSERSWPFNRVQGNVKYVVYGDYTSVDQITEELSKDEISQAVEAMDKQADAARAEAQTNIESIKPGAQAFVEVVKAEVAAGSSNIVLEAEGQHEGKPKRKLL